MQFLSFVRRIPGGGLTCAARISSVEKNQAVRILIELRFVRQWQQKSFELLKWSFYNHAFFVSLALWKEMVDIHELHAFFYPKPT